MKALIFELALSITLYIILSRDGGTATTETLCIESLSITRERLCVVAVVVSAKTLTFLG